MIELHTAIWASVGLLVYYSIYYLWDTILKMLSSCNTPNRIISNLRTKYNINIRTFQRNTGSLAFAWFRTVWLNERLFKSQKLLFAFHHEHYHVTHNHKAYVLLMRFIFSLFPLFLVVVHWSAFIVIFLGAALLIEHISEIFEKNANEYASEITSTKKKKNNMLASDLSGKSRL